MEAPSTPGSSKEASRIIVLDTAALIAGSDSLFTLGGLRTEDGAYLDQAEPGSCAFYTTADVVNEVRDPAARARLKLLEGIITLRAPSQEALAHVAQFAKTSGDYTALSLPDLRVLALVYMLEHERNGAKYLRPAPETPKFSFMKGIPAHVLDAQEEEERLQKEKEDADGDEEDAWTTVTPKKNPVTKKQAKQMRRKRAQAKRRAEKDTQENLSGLEGDSISASCDAAESLSAFAINAGSNSCLTVLENETSEEPIETQSESSPSAQISESCIPDIASERPKNKVSSFDFEVAGSSTDSDNEGWITEENVDECLARDGGEKAQDEEEDNRVACVTTDFAMQNVLMQMGLRVLSTDGRRTIRQIRRYVLRCHACGTVTRELERKFCDKCGNATLHRASFKVNKKGVARVFLNPRRKPNLRGTKYSIPMPKGGRHNKDLILREDQIDPVQQRRIEKQRAKLNVDVLDPGSFYNAGAKFRPHDRPIIVGYGRRNPNESRPGSKSRKR